MLEMPQFFQDIACPSYSKFSCEHKRLLRMLSHYYILFSGENTLFFFKKRTFLQNGIFLSNTQPLQKTKNPSK